MQRRSVSLVLIDPETIEYEHRFAEHEHEPQWRLPREFRRSLTKTTPNCFAQIRRDIGKLAAPVDDIITVKVARPLMAAIYSVSQPY